MWSEAGWSDGIVERVKTRQPEKMECVREQGGY